MSRNRKHIREPGGSPDVPHWLFAPRLKGCRSGAACAASFKLATFLSLLNPVESLLLLPALELISLYACAAANAIRQNCQPRGSIRGKRSYHSRKTSVPLGQS